MPEFEASFTVSFEFHAHSLQEAKEDTSGIKTDIKNFVNDEIGLDVYFSDTRLEQIND